MSDQKGNEAEATNEAGEETRAVQEPLMDVTIDIKDRDPNHINDHVKVRFHDIIAEPDESIYSFDKVWLLSEKVYDGSKLWCYRITSLICALPASCCWGVSFACLSFANIWCYEPYLRCYEIECFCIRRVFHHYTMTFIAPCFEAIGKIFSSIKVSLSK